MTTEECNTALYKKMFAEQDAFRDWLKSQPPEEILNHAYEYTTREDILLSLEYQDLSAEQAVALMSSPCPISDVFKDFEKLETDHMSVIWECGENRADKLLTNQRQACKESSQDENTKLTIREKLQMMQPTAPHKHTPKFKGQER